MGWWDMARILLEISRGTNRPYMLPIAKATIPGKPNYTHSSIHYCSLQFGFHHLEGVYRLHKPYCCA